MISTSRADAFMDKLITLVNSDFKTVKDMDVVLLLGGTGNGKSTVMNMIAGSKIFAEYDDKMDIWKFEAQIQTALIGHNNSMTFIPNYWQGASIRVYDCPGFNDNRSIEHQIVKSFFIKEIADQARSIKVIIVADIHSIHANRCGPIEDCFKQMKQLIPKFNPTTDCSILVTKARRRNKPKQIFQKFKQIGVQISEEKIILLYEPQEDGEYDYSYMIFEDIVTSTPALRDSCNLPLSSDARLKLIEINQELNHSIERAAASYSSAVRRYYLQVITSNISINNQSLKELYENIVESEETLKLSNCPQQFIANINEISLRIQQVGKIKFNFQEICVFIKKKYDQMIYLKDKVDDFKFDMSHWIMNIHFQCQSFERSKNVSNLKSTDTLQAYLRDNLRTDLSTDIKSQIHAYLNKVNTFPATYSGSKNISGHITHSKNYSKECKIPYVAQVEINEYIPYSGYAKYQGSKEVEVSVNIMKCRCNRGFFNVYCVFCSHKYFDLKETVTAKYDGQAYYSGKVHYINKEKQVFYATFTTDVNQSVTKQYNETVPYSGNHTANCRDHHVCSCEKLADIVIAANEVTEQITYYKQIVRVQRKELQKLGNTQQVPEDQGQNAVDLFGQLNINGYQFIATNLTRSLIIQQIHNQLTTQYNFSEFYCNSTTYNVSRSYSQTYLCQGTRNFNNNLTHKAQVPYFGSIPYSSSKYISGYISTKSCYENCSICTVSYSDVQYSKKIEVHGTQQYSGTVSYNRTYSHSHQLKYSENVPYSGVITKQLSVPYEGYNQVKCEKSTIIGTGHHSCTSCSTWEKFVAGLKGLLNIQNALIEKIQSNKREINELIERQQMENRRLEQELVANTVG